MMAAIAHRFGDDINTDYIIAAHRKAESANPQDLAKYTFQDIDPDFVNRVAPGDLVVAGRNFGCGSSRETAVHVLNACGVKAVVAESFARIFFRNAINNGLLVVECDTSTISQGDVVDIDIPGRVVRHDGEELAIHSVMPPIVESLIEAGGLLPYLQIHGDLVLPAAADSTNR